MRIATWNINSVRLRAPLVRRLAEEAKPDVLCLQETKTPDDAFPHEALADVFPHRVVHGMKGYNGVAILSRLPLSDTGTRNWCDREDCRHTFARLPNGTEVHNFYIPSGGAEPDPAINDKFAHKLAFLDALADWGKAFGRAEKRPRVMVGDLNVAPLENDVWSHKALLNVVSHTPIEVEKLTRAQDAYPWHDAVRHFVPAEKKLYSWWSYRARDWRASNRGRRLDHIWISPDLVGRLASMRILCEARGWPSPSDHVPVMIDLAD